MSEKHLKTKKLLKIIGISALVAGIACVITGFVDFFSSIGEGMPKLFFLMFIGFPLTAAGAMMTIFGFRREIQSYTMQETAPVFNEATKSMSPGFQTIANAVSAPKKTCACGAENPAENTFCASCGAKLTKTCPSCGEQLNANDAFCGKCGNKLD